MEIGVAAGGRSEGLRRRVGLFIGLAKLFLAALLSMSLFGKYRHLRHRAVQERISDGIVGYTHL